MREEHGEIVSSDVGLLDLLRKVSPQTVNQLADAMGVTATAVRQRLTRLMAQGLVERASQATRRGRPSHQYRLTLAGRRRTGANFADLAVALWEEVRAIGDPEVRRGLLQRISRRLAERYSEQISGTTLEEKMESLAAFFAQKRIPFVVSQSSEGLPILNATACPYPDLAEQDRSVCAMERLLFEEMLGQQIRLSNCRLDGGGCCEFTPGASPSAN
ncbi:MAG: MarR family transcriptional regulator [Planctomycetales bacterium]|nr:MarR family transcriptional regulator [Planctomycetales bacterium]